MTKLIFIYRRYHINIVFFKGHEICPDYLNEVQFMHFEKKGDICGHNKFP